jgi:hypothetical protein
MSMNVETAIRILSASGKYDVFPNRNSILSESEEVYEDDVRDWIIEDSETAVKDKIENFKNAILNNYPGADIASVSDVYVEDVNYLRTRNGTSYSGIVFATVKVYIPNKKLIGSEELDVERILDKVEVTSNSKLRDVEWNCTYCDYKMKYAYMEFELRGSYSSDRR